MPLVINALGGGHTDRQTDRHTYTGARTKAISRPHACGGRPCAPDLKIINCVTCLRAGMRPTSTKHINTVYIFSQQKLSPTLVCYSNSYSQHHDAFFYPFFFVFLSGYRRVRNSQKMCIICHTKTSHLHTHQKLMFRCTVIIFRGVASLKPMEEYNKTFILLSCKTL